MITVDLEHMVWIYISIWPEYCAHSCKSFNCDGDFLSELCPNKGMPLLNSAGNAQRCASTMDCGDGTYSCQSSNIDGYKYCCPAKLLITGTVNISREKIPLVKSAVYLKSCRLIVILHDYRDMSILLLSEMCPNIGYVLVHDGHPKRCSLDFECISSSGEFSCVKNYCCPKDPSQGKVKQQSVCLYRAHANVSNIWINIACQINKVFPF